MHSKGQIRKTEDNTFDAGVDRKLMMMTRKTNDDDNLTIWQNTNDDDNLMTRKDKMHRADISSGPLQFWEVTISCEQFIVHLQ